MNAVCLAMFWLLVSGSWSLVIGSWLLALNDWFLVIGHSSLAVWLWRRASGRWLQLLASGHWLIREPPLLAKQEVSINGKG